MYRVAVVFAALFLALYGFLPIVELIGVQAEPTTRFTLLAASACWSLLAIATKPKEEAVSFIALKVMHQGTVRYYEDIADLFAAVQLPNKAKDAIRSQVYNRAKHTLYANDHMAIVVELQTRSDLIAALNEREAQQ